MDLPQETITELEAAAFRRLVQHLRDHADVQNIDMMNLAGFCRNCLGNWIEEAAKARNLPIDRATARAHVYGMPYEQWKALHQKEAGASQLTAFSARMKDH
jgi:hypothetical protein